MAEIHLMSTRHSAFYTPYLLTLAGGFLKDEGLEPKYSVATPPRTVADCFKEGSCHVAQSAVAASFPALEAGEPVDIVHFAQINARDGFFIAAREPDPDFSWERLKGKKVLVDHLFQPLAMFKYGLHRAGVNFDELEVIDAGGVDEIERAFRHGTGEYVHMQGPVPQQLEHEGLGYVVASVGEVVGPVAFSSLCASREWLTTDMARAFMRAYRRSLEYAIEAPADEIAAREEEAGLFPNIDRSVLAETVKAYQGLGCWERDPTISKASYDKALEVFLYSGLIRHRHGYGEAVVPPPV